MSSKFFSTAQLEHCSTLLISSKLLSIHLSSSACHKAFTAREKSLAHKNHCKENLDAATTMRSADTDLRNTEELRATASEIAAPQPDLDAKAKKRRFWSSIFKGILQGKLLAQKLRISADKSLSQLSYSHSNTIYEIQLQKTLVLRMQPRHQATFTQPLQCDLQPQIQEKNRSTHAGTTTRGRTQRRNPLRPERPQPQPPHTRGTFHRRLQPLHTEKYKVSCSGFPPKQSPCNMHAAITIRFAASCSKPASLYAHGNTGLQQSCSLSNAICNHRFKKRIELRTQEQPLVAEHRGGTHYARNDRSRNRRTHELPFIAGCSHFTRKNTRFRAPASPQNKAHATCMQPLQYVSQHPVANLHLSTHMATPDDNNHAASPMRSATTDSRKE